MVAFPAIPDFLPGHGNIIPVTALCHPVSIAWKYSEQDHFSFITYWNCCYFPSIPCLYHWVSSPDPAIQKSCQRKLFRQTEDECDLVILNHYIFHCFDVHECFQQLYFIYCHCKILLYSRYCHLIWDAAVHYQDPAERAEKARAFFPSRRR